MHINRLLLLLGLLVVLPFQKTFAQQFPILNQTEELHGKVKTIIETRDFKRHNVKNQKSLYAIPDDNTRHRNQIVNSGFASEIYFDNKYIKPDKEQDTVGVYCVDIFNRDADLIGMKCYFKDKKLYYRNVFKHGLNDLDFNITEFCIYNSNDSLVFRQIYSYNNKGFLTKAANYSNDKKIKNMTIFTYISFDRKGNWTKRMEKTLKKGMIVSVNVVERKITYY